MSSIRIDSISTAILIHRYIALVKQDFYYTKGTIQENKVNYSKNFYQIQWKNIIVDIRESFSNPIKLFRPIALVITGLLILSQKTQSHFDLLIMGAVSFDAAAQSNHSGEPATITWSHTIGSGSNRLININASGLGLPSDPLWDSNTTTDINTVGSLVSNYYLNPSTGSANCSVSGGNIKVGGSISFFGVDQTDPIGASTTEDGTASPNDITLVTEANDSMRVDVLGANRDDATDPTGTLDSGDLRCNDVVPNNQFRIGLFAYTNFQATAGSDTHQWTTSGFNRYYSAFEIKASSGTTTSPELLSILGAG